MIEKIKNVFILGIKGVAMSNLALILTKMGKKVYGWDIEEDFITKPVLDSLAIKVFNNNQLNSEIIKKTEMIIYSAAHQGNKNPLLKKFSLKIPRVHQIKVISEIMKRFSYPIAIAGSHGKTTTSSLLSYSLIKLKQKPSYLVGSSGFNEFYGGDYYFPNETKYFIIEADEYGLNPPYDKTPKLLYLNPKLIIATNIDFDHPDVYKNLKEIKKTFLTFFNKKMTIACGDDLNLIDALRKTTRNQYLLYGFKEINDYQIKNWLNNEKETQFDLYYKNNKIDNFTIKLFGRMNINNAAAVIVTLLNLGFTAKKIKSAIANFKGAKRRFEEICSYKNTYLFDDYAHHPTEIEKTIEGARLRFPKRRIIVIFQPHTYSRTKNLYNEFALSLSRADLSLILPIFPSARELVIKDKISSQEISQINPKKIVYIRNRQQLQKKLLDYVKEGDIIFTMGAGNVYQFRDIVIEVISKL